MGKSGISCGKCEDCVDGKYVCAIIIICDVFVMCVHGSAHCGERVVMSIFHHGGF